MPAWHHTCFRALLCVACVASMHTNVSAQEPDDPTEAVGDVQFDAEAARARTLYAEENFDEAIKAFERAYKIKQKPNILYNIGRIYEKKGDFEQATSYYERFVNEPDVKLAARQDALARLKSLNEVLALRKKPEEEPEPPVEEVKPPVEQPIPEEGPFAIPPPPIEAPSRTLPITLIALGGVGLISGGVFTRLTSQTFAQTQETNDLERLRSLRTQGSRQALIADASMIAGGALLISGTIMWVVRQRKYNKSLALTLTQDTQGATFTWSF